MELLANISSVLDAVRVPCAAMTLAVILYLLMARRVCEAALIKRVPRVWLLALLGAFAAALVLRVVVYPHHAGMLNDDFYHIMNAREFLDSNFHPFNTFQKPTGWPFLISLSMWATGPNMDVVFYMNSVLGAVTVIPVFLLVWRVTGSGPASGTAAFLLAIHPLHTVWSICGENNIASILFMCLCLLYLMAFVQEHHPEYIYLALFTASFAVQIRVENIILFPFIALGIFLLARELFDVKRFVLHSLAPLLLAMPTFVRELLFKMSQDWAASDTLGKVSGSNVSWGNFISNTQKQWELVQSGNTYAVVILALGAAGAALAWKQRNRIIIFFTLLGATYFVAISSLWTTLVSRERFFLYTELCLLAVGPLALCCLPPAWRRYKEVLAVAAMAGGAAFSLQFHAFFLNPQTNYFYYGRHMTQAVRKVDRILPDNAIIIMQDPTPLQAVTDKHVLLPQVVLADLGQFLNYPELYYLSDIGGLDLPDAFFYHFTLKRIFSIPVNPEIEPESMDYGLFKLIPRQQQRKPLRGREAGGGAPGPGPAELSD